MPQAQTKKEQIKARLAFIAVLAIFSMGQIAGSIDSAIAMIGEEFHLSQASTLYVSSISAIAGVIFGLVIGKIAGRKVKYRTITLFSAVLILIGGMVPFLITNYALLLVFRVIFGMGFGSMMCLENTFATLALSAEQRVRALGLGMFTGFATNCILQFVGGLLADIHWNYVFLNHLILLIPFIILFIGCPDIPNHRPQAARVDKNEKRPYPPSLFIMCIVMALVGLLISPLLIGCSFLSAKINPSATVAGVVAVCFSLGCMIGGLLFPLLSRKSGRFPLPSFFPLGQ